MGCSSSKPKVSKKNRKSPKHIPTSALKANSSIKSVLSTKSALSPRKGSARRPNVPSLEKRVSFNGVDDIMYEPDPESEPEHTDLKKRQTLVENPANGTKLLWLAKLKESSKQKAGLKKKTEEGKYLYFFFSYRFFFPSSTSFFLMLSSTAFSLLVSSSSCLLTLSFSLSHFPTSYH